MTRNRIVKAHRRRRRQKRLWASNRTSDRVCKFCWKTLTRLLFYLFGFPFVLLGFCCCFSGWKARQHHAGCQKWNTDPHTLVSNRIKLWFIIVFCVRGVCVWCDVCHMTVERALFRAYLLCLGTFVSFHSLSLFFSFFSQANTVAISQPRQQQQ